MIQWPNVPEHQREPVTKELLAALPDVVKMSRTKANGLEAKVTVQVAVEFSPAVLENFYAHKRCTPPELAAITLQQVLLTMNVTLQPMLEHFFKEHLDILKPKLKLVKG